MPRTSKARGDAARAIEQVPVVDNTDAAGEAGAAAAVNADATRAASPAAELGASADETPDRLTVPAGASAAAVLPADPIAVTGAEGSADAAAAPRRTKAVLLRDLLAAPGGASLAVLIAATGWQPHTVRAALSGLRKAGLAVTRRREGADTVYAVGAGEVADADQAATPSGPTAAEAVPEEGVGHGVEAGAGHAADASTTAVARAAAPTAAVDEEGSINGARPLAAGVAP